MKHKLRPTPGFTLIELLTVMAIIGILAGITFNVMSGVNESKAVSRAQLEIARISSALEVYKKANGSYPVYIPGDESGSNERLFQALAGLVDEDGNAINPIADAYIVFDAFNLNFESDSARQAFLNDRSIGTAGNVQLLDPWGQPYLYFYDKISAATSWRNPSFVLYSAGPDGAHTVPNELNGGNGVIQKSELTDGTADTSNLDNVVADF